MLELCMLPLLKELYSCDNFTNSEVQFKFQKTFLKHRYLLSHWFGLSGTRTFSLIYSLLN